MHSTHDALFETIGAHPVGRQRWLIEPNMASK